MKRRAFLSHVLTSSGLFSCASLGLPVWAQNASTSNSPRLLMVFLRGAYDADSVLFQHQNSFYFDQRPNIAVGRKAGSEDVLVLNDTWALHPSLAALQPWVEKKQFAFVPFSGSADNSRSHFKAQDIMEQGAGALYKADIQTGLMNRIVGEMTKEFGGSQQFGGACFASGNPAICRGSTEMPSIELKDSKAQNEAKIQKQMQILRMLYKDPDTSQRLAMVGEKQQMARKSAEMKGEHGADANVSTSYLSKQFAQMGKLMAKGGLFSAGFVDVKGWDTHFFQGNDKGPLSTKLNDLSEALAGFIENLGPAWSSTQIVVMSEFGRTFKENGNKGTDHGHGTTLWLGSGQGFSGNILGEQHIIQAGNLHEDRDQPVLNEYRKILQQHTLTQMGLSAQAIKRSLYLA